MRLHPARVAFLCFPFFFFFPVVNIVGAVSNSPPSLSIALQARFEKELGYVGVAKLEPMDAVQLFHPYQQMLCLCFSAYPMIGEHQAMRCNQGNRQRSAPERCVPSS
ncbi:hypothetical protein F5Y16DRAFT_361261 [Xylariaceae sp. FL0255]|nr:hypothetical protein F5Y16DRAFT_361261 [Xylariaceae sp. FL0255]